MKRLKYFLGIAVLLGVSSQAMAVSCEVQYQAKRVKPDSHWYGTVNLPEFKSGTAKGDGADLKACEKDALGSVQTGGWQIISHKLK